MHKILSKDGRKLLMGIAIIAVYVYHLFFYGENHVDNPSFAFITLRNLTGNGYLGVDIFFFISTFGLCYSYKHNKLSVFYKHRIMRIFPTYVVFALIFAFIYPCIKEVNTPENWLRQITGLNTFRDWNITCIDWYTPALIVVYLTFPILFIGISKMMRYRWSLLIILALLIVFRDHLCLFLEANFANRIGIILLGIFTYLVLEEDKSERFLLPFFLVVAVLSLCTNHNMIRGSYIIPLLLIALGKIELPKNTFVNIISFLGGLSFEIYLAQVITLQYLFTYSRLPLWQLFVITLIATPIVTAALFFGKKFIMLAINKVSNVFSSRLKPSND